MDEQRTQAMLAALHKWEWIPMLLGMALGVEACPSCGSCREEGHRADCQLHAAIATAEHLAESNAKLRAACKRLLVWWDGPRDGSDYLYPIVRQVRAAIGEPAATGKEEYFVPGCTCHVATTLPDGTRFLGGVDDCPVHGFGADDVEA